MLSGVSWGADGVVLGVALAMAPFVGAAALVAPLAVAALHDGLATGWMLAFNGATGRLKQFPRSLSSRHGLVLCAAAVIGGPIAMSGLPVRHQVRRPGLHPGDQRHVPGRRAPCSPASSCASASRAAAGWASPSPSPGAVVVTYTPPAGDVPLFYLGIGLAAVATLGWGVEGVLAIHAMKAIEPVVAGTLRMATSFVVYLVVVLPLAGGLGVFASRSAHASFWLVLGAAAAGAASYLTYYAANHLVGASRAMPINSLYAVWAIVFSVVLTGAAADGRSSWPAC